MSQLDSRTRVELKIYAKIKMLFERLLLESAFRHSISSEWAEWFEQ